MPSRKAVLPMTMVVPTAGERRVAAIPFPVQDCSFFSSPAPWQLAPGRESRPAFLLSLFLPSSSSSLPSACFFWEAQTPSSLTEMSTGSEGGFFPPSFFWRGPPPPSTQLNFTPLHSTSLSSLSFSSPSPRTALLCGSFTSFPFFVSLLLWLFTSF